MRQILNYMGYAYSVWGNGWRWYFNIHRTGTEGGPYTSRALTIQCACQTIRQIVMLRNRRG